MKTLHGLWPMIPMRFPSISTGPRRGLCCRRGRTTSPFASTVTCWRGFGPPARGFTPARTPCCALIWKRTASLRNREPPMPRINHIALKVADLEAATKFYENVYGFKQVKTGRSRGHISRHMTDGYIDLALML